MKEQLQRFRGNVTAKVLFIGFLALLLLVPMSMIEELIVERTAQMRSARAEIGHSWGNPQVIGGPMLVVPFRYTRLSGGKRETVGDVLYVLPGALAIDGSIATQTLRRSLYDVPVYTATLGITGELAPPNFDASYQDLEVLWSEARVELRVSDARSIREPVRLRIGDREAEFRAGGRFDCAPQDGTSLIQCTAADPVTQFIVPAVSGPAQRIFPPSAGAPPSPRPLSALVGGGLIRPSAAIALPMPRRALSIPPGDRLVVPFSELELGPLTEAVGFTVDLTIGGTERLHFLPFGDVTRVALNSAWPSPSFNGAFLPSERSVTSDGFTASWRVLALGRGYPSMWQGSAGMPQEMDASSFGVELITPVGVHEATLRAAKYAALFFGVTFLVYFLFEIFASLRLHALQYLLVGIANCVFFLLLLALAEHVGFGLSYGVSALASTVLIGGYSAAVLSAGRRAWTVIGLVAAMYAGLYVTLKSEDYALLFGAIGLFTLLAAFMALTRRVDWFAITLEGLDSASRHERHSRRPSEERSAN